VITVNSAAQPRPGPIGDLAGRAERNIGQFIRDLRSNARISLRELADRAGVSNPYLSQIERGLRRPSAEVLSQLADALRVSTALMYLRAGLLQDKEGHSVVGAIAADPDLTPTQKQSLTQIYEAFRRENARGDAATVTVRSAAEPAAPSQPRRTRRASGASPAPSRGREDSRAAPSGRQAHKDTSSGRGRTTKEEGRRS
jgi:transcriptional regulator with XRE-family HTH domain